MEWFALPVYGFDCFHGMEVCQNHTYNSIKLFLQPQTVLWENLSNALIQIFVLPTSTLYKLWPL